MMRLRISALIAILFGGSSLVHAQNAYFGFGAGFGYTDISTVSGKDSTFNYKLFGGLQPKNGFGLELGAFLFEELERDTDRDSDGEFTVSFARRDLYFGPSLRFRPKNFMAISAKVGLTYSQIEMTVKESFDLAGHPSTFGRPDRGNQKADRDALAI